MDLQNANFRKLGEDLLPFLGRQLAAATLELDRIGAIGALQGTAMRQFGEYGERNAEGLSLRATLLQHRKPIRGIAGRYAGICQRWAHDVFSRASVKNPLSARSCSMAMTSVPIAPRSAAFFSASWSIIASTLRTPSHSCSASIASSPREQMPPAAHDRRHRHNTARRAGPIAHWS